MKYWILLVLLLVACEDIPEQGTEIIHNVNIEVGKLSQDPLFPGGILHYNYTLLNVGREDAFDVAIETRMIKKSTGVVVAKEGVIVALPGLLKFKESGMAVPKDVTKGEYELALVITYDDGSDAASFTFRVDVEEVEEVIDVKVTSKSKDGISQINISQINIVQEETKETVDVVNESLLFKVVIQDYAYVPAELVIPVGATIEWYNNDSVPHTATGAGFDSGPLPKGETFRHTFNKAIIKPYTSTTTEGPAGTITIQ